MTKLELVAKIAENGNLSKRQAEETLALMFKTIQEIMIAGEQVAIPGFGKFSVATRKARTGINPQTKKTITIPECKVPRFSAAQALKDAVRK